MENPTTSASGSSESPVHSAAAASGRAGAAGPRRHQRAAATPTITCPMLAIAETWTGRRSRVKHLYNAIIARAPATLPELSPTSHPLVSKAIKTCVPNPKMLRSLQGMIVTTGGAFTFPKDAKLTSEQMRVLGCLAEEIKDSGISFRL
jgi:hypothetical protein